MGNTRGVFSAEIGGKMQVGDIYRSRTRINRCFIILEVKKDGSVSVLWEYNRFSTGGMARVVSNNFTKVMELLPLNKLSEKVYPNYIKVEFQGLNFLVDKKTYEKFNKVLKVIDL